MLWYVADKQTLHQLDIWFLFFGIPDFYRKEILTIEWFTTLGQGEGFWKTAWWHRKLKLPKNGLNSYREISLNGSTYFK